MSNNDHVGTVVSLNNGNAVIQFRRGTMCDHCGACEASGRDMMKIELQNRLGAKAGDLVRVSMSGRSLVTASVLAYVIPLALFLAGVLIGVQFSELTGIFLGILFCAVSFFVLRAVEKKVGRTDRFEPVMTEIMERKEEDHE